MTQAACLTSKSMPVVTSQVTGAQQQQYLESLGVVGRSAAMQHLQTLSVFGEGSFDKAIYVSLPLDWIISSPNQARRR